MKRQRVDTKKFVSSKHLFNHIFSTQQAERPLKRNGRIEEKLNSLDVLIEYTEECFLVLDSNLEIVNFSNRFKQLYIDFFEIELVKGESVFSYSSTSSSIDLKEMFRKVFEGHMAETELQMVGTNGEIYNFVNKYKPVFDEDKTVIGVFIAIFNTTDSKRLRESEEKYKSILENSIHASFLTSPDGTILDANKTATEMFGYNVKEFQELGRQGIIDHNDQHFIDLLKVRDALHKVQGEFTGIRKNGEYFPCEFSSNTYKDNNGEVKCCTFVSDISERKRIEKGAERVRKRFRALVENAGDIIILMNREGNIIYVSPAFEKITGFSSAEVLYKHNLDFVHPEKVEEINMKFHELLENPSVPQSRVCRILTKNGDYIWVEGIVTNLLQDENIEAIVSNYHDFTERKKAEEKIKNNEKRFRSLLQNSTDGLTLFNTAGIILYISPTGKKISGYEEHDLVNKLRPDLIHPDDLSTVSEAYIEVINHPDVVKCFECRLLMLDGSYKWLETSCQNMLGNPTVEAIVLNFRDITERKHQELEKEQLIETLHQNNNDLRQFSYITSHNFKAPLSNLMGFLSLIDDMSIEDLSLKQILNGFKVSTTLLNDTINDLVKILIIRDSDSIEQNEIYFDKIFAQVTVQLQNLLEESQPDIHIDFQHAPTVIFNETYLESIFSNLLTNAIKYRSYSRKLRIAIESKEINNEVMLTFTDNGIGFDVKRHKSKVFGLYQCFHHRPNSKGLGLYLIKSQIESLGGRIEVVSEIEVGTTFILKFKK